LVKYAEINLLSAAADICAELISSLVKKNTANSGAAVFLERSVLRIFRKAGSPKILNSIVQSVAVDVVNNPWKEAVPMRIHKPVSKIKPALDVYL